MKSVRIHIVLAMASCLAKHGSFSEEWIEKEMACSKSSFNRAVADYRNYLVEHDPSKELVFETQTRTYRLVKATF